MEGGEEAVRIWVLVFFLYVSCRVSRFRFFFWTLVLMMIEKKSYLKTACMFKGEGGGG